MPMYRIPTTLAAFAGAAFAGAIAAGPAAAESLSGGSLSRGDSTTRAGGSALGNPGGNYGHQPYGGDTTGIHATDPLGFQHVDSNPVLQNQHPQNWRDRQRAPEASRPGAAMSSDGSRSTWTAVPNSDGTGWAVCKPRAASC
ncbi:hypothetical protein [Nocardia inohanensis]|uniref:hypothetical protein n=1 Tax=Nocardia inohanensis TaxID=209246 RepID=UPI000B226CB2|nr:hypothetical protein [Nocardia inohanensis]